MASRKLPVLLVSQLYFALCDTILLMEVLMKKTKERNINFNLDVPAPLYIAKSLIENPGPSNCSAPFCCPRYDRGQSAQNT